MPPVRLLLFAVILFLSFHLEDALRRNGGGNRGGQQARGGVRGQVKHQAAGHGFGPKVPGRGVEQQTPGRGVGQQAPGRGV